MWNSLNQILNSTLHAMLNKGTFMNANGSQTAFAMILWIQWDDNSGHSRVYCLQSLPNCQLGMIDEVNMVANHNNKCKTPIKNL